MIAFYYQRNINNAKRGHRTYPAVLIGCLGVNIMFRGEQFKVGSQLMTFIKNWFRDAENKTGCRFIIVDAYNEPAVLDYYTKRNGFKYLHNIEDDEKSFYGIPEDESLRTRMLFFDLKIKN